MFLENILKTNFVINIENYNNFACLKIYYNISPLEVVKISFVLYSLNFVLHIYYFILFYNTLEICDITHGDY